MPRRKLSEYRSKIIVSQAFDIPYVGWPVLTDLDVDVINGFDSYVVKVDQAVKGRFKKGLVLLQVAQNEILPAIIKIRAQGYNSFIVEPFSIHSSEDEKYLAISQDRNGLHINLSNKGGVDIEQNQDSIQHFSIDDSTDWTQIAQISEINENALQALVNIFCDNHFTLLEINPYTINNGTVSILDTAIEVDDAGRFFASRWDETDIRNPRTKEFSQEKAVATLDRESSASFNLSVLNPNGSIFLLLSGGGASVVVADEVYNLGLGELLANYGEYSGNPNAHETYLYTREVLSLIAESNASNKVLFIGGASANFTDIASTFDGVIQAINESAEKLIEHGLKIYVRRGGPRQAIGLARMEECLKKHGLFGGVYDPSVSINDAVNEAVRGIK